MGNVNQREPEVGDILLFCIDDAGIHKKYRPFLVVSIVDGDSVSGEVFADPLLDAKTKWALRLFNMLSVNSRTQWVAGILPGDAVGTWKFREAPQQESRAPEKFKKHKITPLQELENMKGQIR